MVITEVRRYDGSWTVRVWSSWDKAKEFEALARKMYKVPVRTFPAHGTNEMAQRAPSARGSKGACASPKGAQQQEQVAA